MKVNVKKVLKNITMYVIVLMFCFVFADTAKAATEYDVYICGEKVTSDNMSGDGWRFEPSTVEGEYDKIYLNNANLVADNSTYRGNITSQGIDVWGDIEIVLTGNNIINMNYNKVYDGSRLGALSATNLRISGTGTLTFKYQECIISDGYVGSFIYAGIDFEIRDGAKLNVEGMSFIVDETYQSSSASCRLIYADCLYIYPNSEINICDTKFFWPDTTDKVYFTAIEVESATVYENAKLNIEMKKIQGKNVFYKGMDVFSMGINDNSSVSFSTNEIKATNLEYYGSEIINFYLDNNVDFSITSNKLESDTYTNYGLYSSRISTQKNTNISINMGSITGSGKDYGLYCKYEYEIGDNCKVLIKGNDILDSSKDNEGIGYGGANIVIGKNTTMASYTGENGNVGCIVYSITMGEDSILKCYGEKTGIFGPFEDTFLYPVYGGKEKTDVGTLTFAKFEYDDWDETMPTKDGILPAKNVEIGPLLTIKLKANGGSINKTSLTMHNGHVIGTLPTPTRTNYTFKGWYTAKTGGTKVTSETKLTKSTTLYARWEVTKPEAMKGFAYKSRTASAITLKWTKNTSATGYLLQQYKNGSWTTVKTITKNTTVSHKVSDLTPSTTYKFRIVPYKTVDGIKAYGGSSSITVKTLPSTVKNFTYSARTAASVTLKWTKNTSADGYVIEQYKGGKWVTIKTIYKADTVSYKVTGLKPSSTNKFRIKAYKKDGNNKLYSLTYVSKTVKTLPSKVTNFTYSARTEKTITLKWTKNTSADGYVIEQYKGGKWVKIKTIYKNDTVNYKLTGLKSKTTYKFRIKAYKKDGSKRLYSFASDTKSVKTL